MLAEIESALVAKLTSKLTYRGLRLTAFPDNINELGKPTLSGQILVGYKRSTFRTVTPDPLTYEQLLQFDINLQLKNLRSHTGVYPLLDEVRFELAGWYCGSAAQKRPAYWQSEAFSDVDEGIWSYTQSLIVPLVIEAGKPPEFATPEPNPWEDLQQIQVVVGLWRSPADGIAEVDVSTKDSEVRVMLENPLDGE